MDLNREIKLAELSPQLRIALVAALGLAAAAAAFLTIHRLRAKSESAAPVVPRTAPRHVAPRAQAKPAARPASTVPQLPADVTRALRRHKPVVIALYAPGSRLDEIEVAEAQAGAARAHAAFVPVDVTSAEVNGLVTRYAALHDPSVLVLDPSGALRVKLDGFADKETVAQAAASAGR